MSAHADRIYDALLIVRFQTGDDAALAELAVRHQAFVVRSIRRWLGRDSASADDLTQEVWVDVVKGLPRLRAPLAWQAWLMRIVRARVASFLLRPERAAVPLDAVVDPATPLPEEPFDAERIDLALAKLGEPHNSLLRLRYWEGRSYQDISLQLKLPLGTVRSRLHGAKARLAEILSQPEFAR